VHVLDDDEQHEDPAQQLLKALEAQDAEQQQKEDAEELFDDCELSDLLEGVAADYDSDPLPITMSTDQLLGGTSLLETGEPVDWLWQGFDLDSQWLSPDAVPPLVMLQTHVSQLGTVTQGEYDFEQQMEQMHFTKANNTLGAGAG
jgi:hypothetical protein